jgi:hypothetical protein
MDARPCKIEEPAESICENTDGRACGSMVWQTFLISQGHYSVVIGERAGMNGCFRAIHFLERHSSCLGVRYAMRYCVSLNAYHSRKPCKPFPRCHVVEHP